MILIIVMTSRTAGESKDANDDGMDRVWLTKR